ncbi:uncharacterized protein LOC125287234 [Alosa alosa]|uniref:uncharacterized protein LOC125287234 n=1 Tax=Alosa alosa TaxID=278164 RepID=UPI0020154312|nr:uncharacterized protein LOC125287234 [Alosa alosa]
MEAFLIQVSVMKEARNYRHSPLTPEAAGTSSDDEGTLTPLRFGGKLRCPLAGCASRHKLLVRLDKHLVSVHGKGGTRLSELMQRAKKAAIDERAQAEHTDIASDVAALRETLNVLSQSVDSLCKKVEADKAPDNAPPQASPARSLVPRSPSLAGSGSRLAPARAPSLGAQSPQRPPSTAGSQRGRDTEHDYPEDSQASTSVTPRLDKIIRLFEDSQFGPEMNSKAVQNLRQRSAYVRKFLLHMAGAQGDVDRTLVFLSDEARLNAC